MKLLTAFTVAAVALTGIAAPAVAQRERVVIRERTVTHREGYRDHRPRQICTVRYRHHARVRTCRYIR